MRDPASDTAHDLAVGLSDTALRETPLPGPSGPRPGTMIAGRYRLVKRIGKGGMAEVWRATHEELLVDVAVKLFSLDLARDPEVAPLALARFRFEAQVSAHLGAKTRHVVAVHDAGTHEGVPFLVMELVAGRDLEYTVGEQGCLEPWRVAGILDQVADALDTAHAMGIVHRDIKPSNILLVEGPDGADFVKLADFGIAKATAAGGSFQLPRATMHGMLVGSPSYMSPEQAEGKSEIEGASDIWSLGAVAYEALTGKTCFDGRSLTEILVAVTSRRYTPMSEIRPSLGKALDRWLERCLALDPAERFDTVAEMSKAFREALPARTGAASGLRGKRMAILAAPALVAVLGGAAYLWGGKPTAASPPPETPASVPSSPAPAAPDTRDPAPAQPAPAPADPPVAPSSTAGPGPGTASPAAASPSPGEASSAGHTAPSTPPAAAAATTVSVSRPHPSSVPTPPPAAEPKPTPKTIDPSEIH